MLEKTLESPLDCKEIQPVHPKEGQCWVFIARTDVESETPIIWPPDVKSWLIWKDPDAGKDWGQEEKGTTGWDDWMASPTSVDMSLGKLGSWWWTGRPGVLQSMGSPRVGHDWATELNWTELSPASGRSLVTESGDYSLVAVSLVAEHRLQAHQLSGCSLWSLERRLGICCTGAQVLCSMWDSPGPGIEPVSPAKPGRLLPFVPPRKPGLPTFCQQWVN